MQVAQTELVYLDFFTGTHLKTVKIQVDAEAGAQKYSGCKNTIVREGSFQSVKNVAIFGFVSLSINVSVNFPLLPSPIFELYNILRSDRLSSVAEERLSSVRLTHLPLNNLITLQNNACVSLTKLVLCCSKYPEGKWLGHG